MMFKKINDSFKEKINKFLLITSFVLFLLILIWIIIFKCIGFNDFFSSKLGIKGQIIYNIDKNIYERFVHQFDYSFHLKPFINDIIPNILVFIPFGFLLFLLNKNKFIINVLITLLLSVFFEIFQLITGIGGFVFLDLINNVLGGLIGFILGYAIYKLLIDFFKKEYLFNSIINYFLLIFIVLALPFTIYIYYEVIINFDIFLPCFSLDNYRNLFNFN